MIYALFGLLWVAASDTALAMAVHEPALLTLLQTWKGWLFVGISAVLIYAVGIRLLRAIEDSERRYRLLFAGSPEALILYDPETLRLVEVNSAAAKLGNYSVDEMCDLSIYNLIDKAGHPALERELPRLRSQAPAGGRWQVRRKDGRLIDVATHSQSVTIDGRNLRLVLIVDITTRLRAEVELLHTLDDLVAANHRLRDLGHAVSHDLQEPLRQVSSFVQLLQRRYRSKLDAEADQFIGFAVEGVTRLKALIVDMERFTASETPAFDAIQVRTVIAQVIDELRGAIDEANACITVAPLPIVSADSTKLTVAFHALLDNAIKFRAPERPCEIAVDAERYQDGWLFRVRDNGIGIEPKYHETVFSLFRRLHTRDRIPGNGTGLALARKMVEAHGGHIWVEATAQAGTVFAFTLPEAGRTAPAATP